MTLRFTPFPGPADRAALRLMLQDCYDARASETNDDNSAYEGTGEPEQAQKDVVFRPPEEICGNVWFVLYWAWIVLWNEHPWRMAAGISTLAFFGAANTYFHLIMPFVVNR